MILRYLQHVVDRLHLREYFTFSTRIVAATYDADANLWTLRTEGGTQSTFCGKSPSFRGSAAGPGEADRTRRPQGGVDATAGRGQ